MRVLNLVLVAAACRPADPPPTEAPVDSGSIDSGSTDSATPPPTSATVTVDVQSGGFGYYPALLIVSAADGSLVRSAPTSAGEVALSDVPIGGAITVAYGTAPYFALFTVGGVEDGDVLHPGVDGWGAPTGTFDLTVPQPPGGAGPQVEAYAPCLSLFGVFAPRDEAGALRDTCSDPSIPAAAWLEAWPDTGDGPAAVAWRTEAAGSADAQSWPFTADQWIADYGRATVSYTHAGEATRILASAWGTRGPLLPAEAGVDLTDPVGGDSVAWTVPADRAFFDRVITRLRRYDGGRSAEVVRSLDLLADRGETVAAELDPAEVPPYATPSVDLVARTADLTLPDGWSCAGRAANVAHVYLQVSGDASFVEWTLSAPYAAQLALPELPPEVDEALAASTYARVQAEAASVPDGYPSIRQTRRVDGDWPALLAERPVGERVCATRSE